MNKTMLLVFFLFLGQFVSASPKQNVNDYFIFQDDKEQTVPVYGGVIVLDRKPFSFRFYNKKYNWDKKERYKTKLSAFINKPRWKKIESGVKKEKSSYYEGGSGFAMAQREKGTLFYNALFFSDSDKSFFGGSHHLLYGNPELEPVTILDTIDDYFKLEFEIDTLFVDKKMVKISDSTLPQIYFSVYNDQNLDGMIDEEELTKFTIKFR